MTKIRNFILTQTLIYLDSFEVLSNDLDSKYCNNFQFANIYIKPPATRNNTKSDNNLEHKNEPKGNADSLSSNSAELNCPSVWVMWRDKKEQSSKNKEVCINKTNKTKRRNQLEQILLYSYLYKKQVYLQASTLLFKYTWITNNTLIEK